jgi:DnaJ-class molecular chaperone
VLSLLPALGAALVWLPVALYFLMTGAIWQGLSLMAWGVLVIGLVDNLLRPMLVGKDTRMPDYVVMISTVGGMADAQGERMLEVTIAPGASQDQKLRLRGKGGKGRNGGTDGDIYLHIQLAQHAVFRPDHHDVYFDLVLTPWEAVLGAAIEVPTLDDSVILTVPAGTRSGRKLRLRGRGLLPDHSDLYAIVHIDVPAQSSERELALYRELAQATSFKPRAITPTEAHHATPKP